MRAMTSMAGLVVLLLSLPGFSQGRAEAPAVAIGSNAVYVVFMGTLFKFDIETLEELGHVRLRSKKQESLRAHATELQNAVELFARHCGDYPARLSDLMANKSAPIAGGNGVFFEAGSWRGPYLTTPDGKLPKNPATGGNDVGIDWLYDAPSGRVTGGPGIAGDGLGDW